MSVENKNKPNGFTLIEIIISLVVLGFALFGLINLFMNLSVQNVAAQYRGTATMLAQELLEEIKAKRFDESTLKDINGNWSNFGNPGTDSGENATNRATFDDVDDYNGWSESLSSPYTGFTRTASVIYVASGDLNTSSTRDNDYKKVIVTVSRGGATYSQLSTLMSWAREQS